MNYIQGDQIKISFKDGSSLIAEVMTDDGSNLECSALSKNEAYKEGDTVFVDKVNDNIEKLNFYRKSNIKKKSVETENKVFNSDEDDLDLDEYCGNPSCRRKLYHPENAVQYGGELFCNENCKNEFEEDERGFKNKLYKKSNNFNSDDVVSEFLNEKTQLSNLLKLMPINQITEGIIKKLHELSNEHQYLSEQMVYDSLTNDERKYLYEDDGPLSEDGDDENLYGIKKESKRFNWEFDKHKPQWKLNKESMEIDKDEDAITRIGRLKKKLSHKLDSETSDLYKSTLKEMVEQLNQYLITDDPEYLGDLVINAKWIAARIGQEYDNCKHSKIGIKKLSTGEPDQDYDTEVYDEICSLLSKKLKGKCTHKEFDKYQGVYITTPLGTLWTVDIYNNGTMKEGYKDITSWLEDDYGNRFSGNPDDYFQMQPNDEFNDYILVIVENGKTRTIQQPKKSDLVKSSDFNSNFVEGSDVYEFWKEGADDNVRASYIPGSKDVSQLLKILKQ